MAFYQSSSSFLTLPEHSNSGGLPPEGFSGNDLSFSQNLSMAHQSISELQIEVSQLKVELEALRNEIHLLKERNNAEKVPTNISSKRKNLPNDLSVC